MIELLNTSNSVQKSPPTIELNDYHEIHVRLKVLVGWSCILFLSMAIFGYSLTVISASSLSMIKRYYEIEFSNGTTLSILNGIIPMGGILGAILAPYILSITRKKYNFYVIAVGFVVSSFLTLVPLMEILLIGRFLLGVFCSLSLGLSLAFMKEFSPSSIRPQLGALYSVFRTIGILLTYGIACASNYTQDQVQHVFVFMGPAFIAILQAILIAIFIPHSPVQVMSRQQMTQLHQIISQLYEPHHIEMAIQQLKFQFLPLLDNQEIAENLMLQRQKDDQIKTNSPINFFISMNNALLRQFCGLTYIVVYAKQIMQTIRPESAEIAPVIANGVHLVTGLFGMILVWKYGRRGLVVLGTICLFGFNLAIGIADQLDESLLTLVSMVLYMIPCGMLVTSVVWISPSEIIPIEKAKYTTVISWVGSAVVTLTPPYITSVTPNDGAYPIFYFFAAYLFITIFLNYFFLVQSKLTQGSKQMKHQVLL